MKKRAKKHPETPKTLSVKRGFTLVELCVVMAVMAILATMIIAFSVLMKGYAEDSSAQNEFLKDVSDAEGAMVEWLSEEDELGARFAVQNGFLVVNGKAVLFSGGTLSLGEERVSELSDIDGISFLANDKLIKCTIFRVVDDKREERSFVFYPRAAEIAIGEEGAG